MRYFIEHGQKLVQLNSSACSVATAYTLSRCTHHLRGLQVVIGILAVMGMAHVQAKDPIPKTTDSHKLYDFSDLDELEYLLEATDMDAVENDSSAIRKYGDVWQRLRSGLSLDLNENNARVTAQQSWFASRQPYIERLSARASRYLYYTVSEAERRQLPVELALLPVIESSYDPIAASHASAVGLWQFIPSTGKMYGLAQNAYYDGRRDVVESTRAAYDFLSQLYAEFGSWELALAAYNAGPYRVHQAMKKNTDQGLPTNYWALKLPQETMNYVPRFFAVAQIIKHPDEYGLTLPKIANRAHFRSVVVNDAVSLNTIAATAGISEKQLKELNPGYLRGFTSQLGSFRVLIPDHLPKSMDQAIGRLKSELAVGSGILASATDSAVLNAEQAAKLLAYETQDQTEKFTTNKKKALPTNSKDLADLAQKEMQNIPLTSQPATSAQLNTATTPVPSLAQALKQVKRDDPVQNTLPVNTAPSTNLPNTVLANSTSTALDKSMNAKEETSIVNSKATKKGDRVVYEVQSGDHLTAIAQKYGVTVDDIANWNQIDINAPLWVGAKIYIYGAKNKFGDKAASAVPDKPTTYKVQSGDGLIAIAAQFGMQPSHLASINGLSLRDTLYVGQQLSLAEADNAKATNSRSAKPALQRYRIRSGESLTSIAKKFNLSVAELAALNDVPANIGLQMGDQIEVPAANSKDKTVAKKKTIKTVNYKLKSGDSLGRVASRYGMSVAELAVLNDIPANITIHAGDTLKVPKK